MGHRIASDGIWQVFLRLPAIDKTRNGNQPSPLALDLAGESLISQYVLQFMTELEVKLNGTSISSFLGIQGLRRNSGTLVGGTQILPALKYCLSILA